MEITTHDLALALKHFNYPFSKMRIERITIFFGFFNFQKVERQAIKEGYEKTHVRKGKKNVVFKLILSEMCKGSNNMAINLTILHSKLVGGENTYENHIQ